MSAAAHLLEEARKSFHLAPHSTEPKWVKHYSKTGTDLNALGQCL